LVIVNQKQSTNCSDNEIRLTSVLKQSPSCKGKIYSVDQEISSILWNFKKSITVPKTSSHASLTWDRLVHITPIHVRHVLMLSFYLSQGLASGFFPSRFSQTKRVTDLYSPHECHTLNPSHLLRFDHPNSIRWGAQIMKLHTTQFSAFSCYFRSAHQLYAA